MRTRGEQQWLLTNASGQFKIQTSKRTCQSPSPPPSNPYYNWSVVLHPDSVNKGYTISRILSCRRIIWPEHQLVLIIAVMPACKCPCDDKIWKQIKKKNLSWIDRLKVSLLSCPLEDGKVVKFPSIITREQTHHLRAFPWSRGLLPLL